MGKNGNNMEDCGNLTAPLGKAGSFTCPPLQPMPFHTLNRVGNPKRLELGDNSTPIPTFSHIQQNHQQEGMHFRPGSSSSGSHQPRDTEGRQGALRRNQEVYGYSQRGHFLSQCTNGGYSSLATPMG